MFIEVLITSFIVMLWLLLYLLYRLGSRKWWRGIKLLYRRVERTPGWQKGRRSGGLCSRQLSSWRAPISITPIPAITKLKKKSPDMNLGDQVIRDRRSKHIAEDEGGTDYEGGRRDHREGVYEGTLTRQSQ